MRLSEFQKRAKKSSENNVYIVPVGNKVFIKPIDENKTTSYGKLEVPGHLKKIKSLAIWEIGPKGKYLNLGSLRILMD